MKRLIVNADDLGRSSGVNRGVLRAHKAGIVTSTTLMANAPRAAEAAGAVRDQRRLGVGVHLVRGRARGEEVLAEFRRQIDHATKLLGRAPTHLDTHHFVQDEPEVLWALESVAKERGLPARTQSRKQRDELRRGGVRTPDHFSRDFYGHEAVSVSALLRLLARLPEGTSEMMCHPAELDDDLRSSSYAVERPLELETLTHPDIAHAIREARITLITFADL